MKTIFFWLLIVTAGAHAAPQCESNFFDSAHDARIRRIQGRAIGFDPGTPVFVTITTADRKYVTRANKNGYWEMLYGNFTPGASLLCWQGTPNGRGGFDPPAAE